MNAAFRECVRAAYRRVIGRAPQDLPTPALILDLAVAKRNIRFMADQRLH
jgi:D-serine deaminase-like pyridoxal phosphate-dependent protein